MVAFTPPPAKPVYAGDSVAYSAAMVAYVMDWLGDTFFDELVELNGNLEDMAPAIQAALAQSGFKGAYNPLTTYQIGESTTAGGDLWLALTINTGVTPAEGANWLRIPVAPPPEDTRFIYRPTGRYIMALDDLGSPSNAAMASTGFAIPFDRHVIIDALAIYGGTGVASSSVRLGIFAADAADGGPGTLLYDLGIMSTVSTSMKTALIGEDYEVKKPVWLVIAQVGGTAPNLPHSTRSNRGGWPQSTGSYDAIGCLRFTLDGTNPFPATFPAVARLETTAAFPLLMARVA